MNAITSLSQRQLTVMLTALLAIAAILAAGGAWLASSFAQQASDRVLRSAVTAIADTLTVEGDEVLGRIPAGAFTFLEESGQDSVFYNIAQGDRILTGYDNLPVMEPSNGELFQFQNVKMLNMDVRLATQRIDLPRQELPVFVQVGETLNERKMQTIRMMLWILGLELALVVAAAASIKPAIRWGLRPLEKLQSQIGDHHHLSSMHEELETHNVPRELRGLVEAYNLLIGRLGDALEAQRSFTGDASHQMRTPIAILKSHVAYLQQSKLPDPAAIQSLDDIAAASGRLERLLAQLLKLARAEGDVADRGELLRTNLSELTADLCRKIAPDALREKVEIQFESDPDCVIQTQPLVVEEIVWNLLENALRYNRPGGIIAVRLSRMHEGFALDVEDTGHGIPESDQEKVFQRFSRLPRDLTKFGSGLGLPIARALAATIGASVILVRSEVGLGSTFRVLFRERLVTGKTAI